MYICINKLFTHTRTAPCMGTGDIRDQKHESLCRPLCIHKDLRCGGTALIRNRPSLGPCSWAMSWVLRWSWGVLFLVSEVPLYYGTRSPHGPCVKARRHKRSVRSVISLNVKTAPSSVGVRSLFGPKAHLQENAPP